MRSYAKQAKLRHYPLANQRFLRSVRFNNNPPPDCPPSLIVRQQPLTGSYVTLLVEGTPEDTHTLEAPQSVICTRLA